MLLQLPVLKTGKNGVSDYNKFVKPEDEMWIKKINQKLTRSAYVMHGQFREDMHQILKNAVTYNTSTADCAHPGPLFVIVLPLVFALFWHCFCTVLALFLRCFATCFGTARVSSAKCTGITA